MNDQVQQFKDLREKLIEIIDLFNERKTSVLLFDKWSIKDVIAHLSGWNNYHLECLRSLKSGQTTPDRKTIGEFNDDSVAARSELNWFQTYNEFVKSSSDLYREYQTVGISDPAIEKMVKIDLKHYQEHLEKIKKLV